MERDKNSYLLGPAGCSAAPSLSPVVNEEVETAREPCLQPLAVRLDSEDKGLELREMEQ